MRGELLLILGHGVKGHGQLWHSVYKALLAQYRLQFMSNHFQTWYVDDEGRNPIDFGSRGHRLTLPPCEGMPRFALSSLTLFLFKCSSGCPVEHYGRNCQYICGHCSGQSCDVATGICPDGCDPGFHGNRCDEGTVFCFIKPGRKYSRNHSLYSYVFRLYSLFCRLPFGFLWN